MSALSIDWWTTFKACFWFRLRIGAVALKLANPHETLEEPDLSEDSPVHYASLFVSFVLSNK